MHRSTIVLGHSRAVAWELCRAAALAPAVVIAALTRAVAAYGLPSARRASIRRLRHLDIRASSFWTLSMLRPTLRQLRLSRTFATGRVIRAQAQRQATHTPKAEDAPIVHYVRRKIEERQKLHSEVRHCISISRGER